MVSEYAAFVFFDILSRHSVIRSVAAGPWIITAIAARSQVVDVADRSSITGATASSHTSSSSGWPAQRIRIDFSGDGSNFTVTVFDGDLPVSSTSGHLENDTLVVNSGHYLSKLEAHLKDGQLEGKLSGRFDRHRYISSASRQSLTARVTRS
jgi:hypothetical protein